MKKGKKKSSGMTKYIVIAIVILILVVGGYLIFAGGARYDQDDMDEFARCLTENGVVMYGAFWCPHCAKTKKKFGSSFKYINYVECDPRGDDEQSELCIEKEIDKYDTWEFGDGSRIISEPSFEILSGKSGCPAPEAQ
jgi:glutaredoxin